MKRMQAEWKNIGPVRRNKSEEVWNRFRAAADKFFERFHNRHQIALAGKLAEREAMVVELETLARGRRAALPADLAERVQQLRTTWNRAVPIPVPEAKVLADRWQTALKALIQNHREAFKGTDLDPACREAAHREAHRESRDVPRGRSGTDGRPVAHRGARRETPLGACQQRDGRTSSNEEAKWRAAAEGVKEAQAAWARLAPVAGADASALEGQFRDACRRVNDLARRHQPQPQHRPSSAPPRRTQPPRPTAAVGA